MISDKNLALGDLLRIADDSPGPKRVISAYKVEADFKKNYQTISRFDRTLLDSCADFLKIPLVSSDGSATPLYSNKEKISRRITFAIKSFFPTDCQECNTTYKVELDDTDAPPLMCFLCYQGSHNCEQVTNKLPNSSDPLIGNIWLCASCHASRNPVEYAPARSHSPSNEEVVEDNIEPAEQPTQMQQTDNSTQQTDNSSQVSNTETSAELPHTQNDLSKDSTERPICERLKKGLCPHGISGKTVHNGTVCDMRHPKRCKNFCRNGPRGCRFGTNCRYFHPLLCKSSVKERKCLNLQCRFTHLKFTKRYEVSYQNQRKQSSSYEPRKPPLRNPNQSQSRPKEPYTSYDGNPLEYTPRNFPALSNESNMPYTKNMQNPSNEMSFLVEMIQHIKKDLQDFKSSFATPPQTSQMSMLYPPPWTSTTGMLPPPPQQHQTDIMQQVPSTQALPLSQQSILDPRMNMTGVNVPFQMNLQPSSS